MDAPAARPPRLRSTLLWSSAAAFALYGVVTAIGVRFLMDYENNLARTIFLEHRATILSVYGRIGIGYLLAGLLAGFLLHPFVRGWKAAPAVLLLAFLVLVHTLTNGTHFLHGPVQWMYSSVRDRIPWWIRDPFRPWMIAALLGVFAALSLWRWSRHVPAKAKVAALAVSGIWLSLHLWPAAHASLPPGPPSFLLIVSDSLRADHLSCNGYPRETSRNIDALAAEGTNFANLLVPTASTHESWISMLSSTEPRVNGLRHMVPSREKVREVASRVDFLPRVLREKGYDTAVIGGWCGNTFRIFDAGFDHVDVSDVQNHRALIAEAAFTNHIPAAGFLDNPLGRLLVPELGRVSFTRSSSVLTRRARGYLEDAAGDGRPFFLAVVYNTTHLPYSAAYPYDRAFTEPDYRGRNRYRIDFKVDDMIHKGFDHDLTPEEMRHVVDLYDGCVKEFDAQVGELVEALRDLGLSQRTIVGVWGDHGDDLYEHGTTLGHGVTLFGGDHANHPPAVFKGPGVPKRRVEELVRSIDLAPTWAKWLGLERPARWEGVDLSDEIPHLWALLETSYLLYRTPPPDLRPGEEPKSFPRMDDATFFDPSFDYNPVLRAKYEDKVIATKCFAVREGPWKLIFVPGETGPILRLFDLSKDPVCEHDVAAEQPEVFARLRARLPEEAEGVRGR
ncbi:MAG TPA: sulfatase [Planctomycetota bacterium]|nr:sulfatase [Planctomycetota bacterium]